LRKKNQVIQNQLPQSAFIMAFWGVPAFKFFLFVNCMLRRRAVRSNLLCFKKDTKGFPLPSLTQIRNAENFN